MDDFDTNRRTFVTDLDILLIKRNIFWDIFCYKCPICLWFFREASYSSMRVFFRRQILYWFLSSDPRREWELIFGAYRASTTHSLFAICSPFKLLKICMCRCLLELDPVAQKHLAKLKRFRGQYDEWGNRIPRSQHQLLGRHLTASTSS